jgi:hypothetical protein
MASQKKCISPAFHWTYLNKGHQIHPANNLLSAQEKEFPNALLKPATQLPTVDITRVLFKPPVALRDEAAADSRRPFAGEERSRPCRCPQVTGR